MQNVFKQLINDLLENILHGFSSEIISETLQTPFKTLVQYFEQKIYLVTFHCQDKIKIWLNLKKNKQTNSKLCPNIVKKFRFRLEKYNNSYTV